MAGESLELCQDERVIRLRRLSEAWSLAEERGRLQPWRGGFGRIGDDKVRADWYDRLAQRLLNRNGTDMTFFLEELSKDFPAGILEELTNTTPLEDGEHGPLFRDPSPIIIDVKAYSEESVMAAKHLLNPTNNQPLLRHSSSHVLLALCTSLLHRSTLSESELQTVAEGKAPLRTGIDDARLKKTLGGTYLSCGYAGIESVGQLRDKLNENSEDHLNAHVFAVLSFLEDLPDDAPVPLEVTAHAGRLDSSDKSLSQRHTEHNTSLEASGARRHYSLLQLCGRPTAFVSIIPLESIQATFLIFKDIITIKSMLEISEALTQSIFKCWHNKDLMGRSEVGGLLKRVNKEVNRQALALRTMNTRWLLFCFSSSYCY